MSNNMSQDRSVSVGGNLTGGVIQTGDRNIASVQFQEASLPAAETVDIRTELNAIRDVLAQLKTPERQKIDNALEDAEEELAKSEPDKDEVGKALERALDYAQKAEGFSAAVENLAPRITKVAAWLGENWYKILPAVGLVI